MGQKGGNGDLTGPGPPFGEGKTRCLARWQPYNRDVERGADEVRKPVPSRDNERGGRKVATCVPFNLSGERE